MSSQPLCATDRACVVLVCSGQQVVYYNETRLLRLLGFLGVKSRHAKVIADTVLSSLAAETVHNQSDCVLPVGSRRTRNAHCCDQRADHFAHGACEAPFAAPSSEQGRPQASTRVRVTWCDLQIEGKSSICACTEVHEYIAFLHVASRRCKSCAGQSSRAA